MTSDTAVTATICGTPVAALIVWAIKYGITLPENLLNSLTPVAAAIGAAGALVALAMLGTKTLSFPLEHRSGYSLAHVRRHENGHARVARALGGSARIDLKAGITYVSGRFTPIEEAAISYGGWAAAGGAGCGEDFRDVEQYLRRLPANQRSAARDEAKRLARRYA